MIAKATVFLTQDRTRAVAEGDPAAKFKLVHVGQEISQAQAEKYEGAIELIGGSKPPVTQPERTGTPHIEHREPHIEHRDPRPKK